MRLARREEKEALEEFGEEYFRYTEITPRFFPKLRRGTTSFASGVS
jgi:protein-S-isoprenylcysteine O-methyltransferase Ste14